MSLVSFSVREILALSGVRTFRSETLGEVHRCPRHLTSVEPTLRAIFLGSSVPYFQCHACGTSVDPVTMLAESTHQSLEAAAEILQSRPTAFQRTDITPHLAQAVRTRQWVRFFDKHRGTYQDNIRGNRLITDPRTDTSTLLYDRCQMSLKELLGEFPDLRTRVFVGKGLKKDVVIQMNYNAAGAPGQIQILSPQGALVHSVHLDHQTPANHLYLAAPPAMLRKDWRSHLAVFNSASEAAPIWDWVMEWLERSGSDLPIAAVVSIHGCPDKADIGRVTVLPIGLDTAWAGAGFSPGFTRVGVLRLPSMGELKGLSAKEVFYSLDSRSAWGNLPTILADFVRTSRRLLDDGHYAAFRSFIEETMSLESLSRSDKNLAAESLGQYITDSQKSLMDHVMNEVCDSPPVNLTDETYFIRGGCYHKRQKETGKELKVTNFIAKTLLRVITTSETKGGGANLLRVTGDSGESTHCLASDRDMGSTTHLMGRIRSAFSRERLQSVVTYPASWRLLGQVVAGTQGTPPEVIEIARLGMDHGTLSYNYPEVTVTTGGRVVRDIGCRKAVDWLTGHIMQPPKVDLARSRMNEFLWSVTEQGTSLSRDLARGMAIACLFAFMVARRSSGVHFAIEDSNLLTLAAKMAGLKRICVSDIGGLGEWPISPSHVPVAFENTSPPANPRFRFKMCKTSEFGSGTPDLYIPGSVSMTDGDLDRVPDSTFLLLIESALSTKSREDLVKRVLSDAPLPFIADTIHEIEELAAGTLDELGMFLEFLLSYEGGRYITNYPDIPGYVMIDKKSIMACFGGECSTQLRGRINRALRKAVGGGHLVSLRPRKKGGEAKSGRFYAWALPGSFLESKSKIVKIH